MVETSHAAMDNATPGTSAYIIGRHLCGATPHFLNFLATHRYRLEASTKKRPLFSRGSLMPNSILPAARILLVLLTYSGVLIWGTGKRLPRRW